MAEAACEERPLVYEDLVRWFADGAKPWFVTGGVAPDTLDDVLATGARRVVVVRALTEAPDPAGVAAELAERLVAA